MGEQVCVGFRVEGRVQGVGFRYACFEQARGLDLCGWVANRADGSVHGILAGPQARVDEMQAWLAHGPRFAQVSKLQLEAQPAVDLPVNFSIR